MRATYAGPGTNNNKTYKDTGKAMGNKPANSDGYRRAGSAAGPGSSHANYVATHDTGKQVG
eukprot:CAMPEP_0201512748 /NCGR_PEP_ID=MMETSP0161_2-20130828/4950_1 /ASSEMBLY_ACC=CAM_ASM_000251 /TAXON_ID=180227 /ORGANISM="Neoparamoeba aestuarina, Strain SoJaBio B1-5/56/2" /LENGTH=60 /DNA_ID=CAMNT_0047908715 /DNA_START=81 /DNA_END=260 /DNA_ORIENTATION=+